MSKPALVSIGTAILKRLPKNTLVTTIHTMEQLAKRHGIKSVGRIARKVKRKVKAIKRRRTTKRGIREKQLEEHTGQKLIQCIMEGVKQKGVEGYAKVHLKLNDTWPG